MQANAHSLKAVVTLLWVVRADVEFRKEALTSKGSEILKLKARAGTGKERFRRLRVRPSEPTQGTLWTGSLLRHNLIRFLEFFYLRRQPDGWSQQLLFGLDWKTSFSVLLAVHYIVRSLHTRVFEPAPGHELSLMPEPRRVWKTMKAVLSTIEGLLSMWQ